MSHEVLRPVGKEGHDVVGRYNTDRVFVRDRVVEETYLSSSNNCLHLNHSTLVTGSSTRHRTKEEGVVTHQYPEKVRSSQSGTFYEINRCL